MAPVPDPLEDLAIAGLHRVDSPVGVEVLTPIIRKTSVAAQSKTEQSNRRRTPRRSSGGSPLPITSAPIPRLRTRRPGKCCHLEGLGDAVAEQHDVAVDEVLLAEGPDPVVVVDLEQGVPVHLLLLGLAGRLTGVPLRLLVRGCLGG